MMDISHIASALPAGIEHTELKARLDEIAAAFRRDCEFYRFRKIAPSIILRQVGSTIKRAKQASDSVVFNENEAARLVHGCILSMQGSSWEEIEAAAKQRVIKKKKSGRGGNRRDHDKAYNHLFMNLVGVWLDYGQSFPTIGRGDRRTPFITFALAAITIITRKSISEQAVVRRYEAILPSRNAFIKIARHI